MRKRLEFQLAPAMPISITGPFPLAGFDLAALSAKPRSQLFLACPPEGLLWLRENLRHLTVDIALAGAVNVGTQVMRSDIIKKGFERAPHRSLLRATGSIESDDDFSKPFIGICNSYTDSFPATRT